MALQYSHSLCGTSVPGDTPVLILTGPPGVGKTLAAGLLLAHIPRAVHLEADHFFRYIRSGYVEPWKPESDEQNRAGEQEELRLERIHDEVERGFDALRGIDELFESTPLAPAPALDD
ncbi:MAG TPA: ATP-binding protein [Solirubrobacterales bacterium]